MSTEFTVHYTKSVRIGEIKPLDTGSRYRQIHIAREYPNGDDKPTTDAATVIMYAASADSLLTENEKNLIAIIKGMLGAMESFNITAISERLQELRQAVEKVEAKQK